MIDKSGVKVTTFKAHLVRAAALSKPHLKNFHFQWQAKLQDGAVSEYLSFYEKKTIDKDNLGSSLLDLKLFYCIYNRHYAV